MARKFQLLVERSPDPMAVGRCTVFSSVPVVIGRSPDCNLVVSDGAVSRRHAEIREEDGHLVLVDAGSANGVWVGGEKVDRHTLRDGELFQIGATWIRFNLVMPALDEAATVREALVAWGDPVEVSGNKPFVIQGSVTCWYVEKGKLELFAVALDRNLEPVGSRTHFMTVEEGMLMFSMDFGAYQTGYGFLAVGKVGTILRRLRIADLRVLAQDKRFADGLAELVEGWVKAVSSALVESILPGPVSQKTLAPSDKPVKLANGEIARSQKGVLWVEQRSGSLLFIGMEQVEPEAESEDTGLAELIAGATKRRFMFPLAPDTWIEAATMSGEGAEVYCYRTKDVIDSPALWSGLSVYHRVLCRCEFINKRLAVVDEYLRLKSKAEYARAAGEAAVREIASVLAPPEEAEEVEAAADPLLEACRLVGKAMGIKVKDHPDVKKDTPFEERVLAIAKASRFRTRTVALRDDWWRRDQGPILAKWEETGSPVALLPKGPRSYRWVDPKEGKAGKVTEEVAAKLSPFAFVFYRPFPDGKLRAWDLIRFGARGLSRDLWSIIVLGLAVGMLGAMTPYFTGKLFDTAIPQADRSLLLQFTSALFVAALATGAFKIAQAIATLRVEGHMDYSIQAALWDRLLNLPLSAFRSYSAGDMADRAQGVDEIRRLVSGAGVNSILGSLSSVFYVVLMFKYSAKLALVAMGLTFLYVAVTTTANYLQLRHERKAMQLRGKITGMVLQFISGVSKLRIAAAENHAFKVWAKDYAAQKRIDFKVGRIKNVVQVFGSGFELISSIAIFYMLYSIREAAVAQGQTPPLSTGEFVAFNAAFMAFLRATKALGDASLDLLRVVPIYDRLRPIVTIEPELDETRAYPGKLKGAIEVSHVSFRYSEDGPWILNDLSVKIRPGEFVAFVGPSGCGKSTLIRLLLGFETPQRGSIYYDGQDLASLDLREVRQQIGVVLQSSTLLPADIFHNIVGSTGCTLREAWEAARLAGLAEDIKQFPMGMHTYISEGGGGLSGGQRQKILIARALVRKPRILIFDEATSALDNRSQAVVTESMEKLKATRIVIAHRLSTIINADRICYLEGGRVVEEGTFDELMALGGRFAQLAKRQMA